MSPEALTRRLAAKIVSKVTEAGQGSIQVHFTDGSFLDIRRRRDGVSATLREARRPPGGAPSGPVPTRRQSEYLAFIRKYTLRFGVPPAESDIQRHFLVSAPSVNLMIQGLERRGFITRERDAYGRTVPRSIRVVFEDE